MTRHRRTIFCLLAAALLGAGWCVGEWRSRSVESAMRNRLLRQAVQVAGTLKPEMVRELSFSAADKGTPAFEFIRSQLTALGKYFPHRGIYCMALRDGRLVFGPEDYPEADSMASPPGTVYEQPAADDFRAFTTAKPIVFGPTTDEYGAFVCALAPVCDPDSGEVLMVVGIDVLANDWKAMVDASRRQALLGSSIALAVLVIAVGIRSCWKRCAEARIANSKPQSARGLCRCAMILRAGRHVDVGLLIGMGALAVVFLAVVLLETLCWTRDHIDATADQQARLAVEFDRALRDYVCTSIRPEMEKRVAEGEFIPEAMSTAFVARSVFDRVREAFPDAVLRLPSTNPRNPANRATPSEESLIRYFEQHPEADTWSGVMEFFEEGEKYFVWAIPCRFEADCLHCHGRPEDAPSSLLERYGPVAGFGRSAGEVSVDLAAIPVSTAYAKAGEWVGHRMLIALVLCVFFLGGIVFLIWADARRRRRAEMAVEREKRFLRLVLDSLPDVVCVKSSEGRFVMANEALAKACGTTVQGVEGKRDVEFSLSSEQFDRWRRDDLEVVTTRKVKVISEESVTCLDGTTRRFVVTKIPLIRDDGECDQILVVGNDITERKRAEEKLRESLSLLEATLESTADGILVVDGQGRIRDLNRQFQELWRIPDSVLALKDDNAALEAALERLKDPDAFLSKVRELYSHPEMESFDLLEFSDGRMVERYSKPQMLGDQVVGRVWSFRDVTVKREAEQRQAALLQRVAEINEELTHFAYVVSHDLKAPLRGIKLIADWLCADYGDKLGDEAKEQLDLLQNRVVRMHNLIDGILQYSRVGRIKEDMVDVDLNELVPTVIDGIAPPEHIRIIVQPDLPVIEGEKTRITQVFQNLLGNAVKFMDKPAGEVRIECVEDGAFWRFRVADNGPGIEDEYFGRIFRLFQTLRSRDEFESTGVGLALVKKIVEMYGGRIWVESKIGEGSTFYFTFPNRKPAVSRSRPTVGEVNRPMCCLSEEVL